MTNKTLTAPQYILLCTIEPMDAVGRKNWTCYSVYDSEEQAIAALLSMPDTSYHHARVVKATLPVLTLPGDFETITGETTHGEQQVHDRSDS